MWVEITSSNCSRGDLMNKQYFNFDKTDQISFMCSCGFIDYTVESTEYGVKVLFHCRDCNTIFAMDVKQ